VAGTLAAFWVPAFVLFGAGPVIQHAGHRHPHAVLHPGAVKDDLRPSGEMPDRKSRQAVAAQHIRLRRHGLSPGQSPQQPGKRGQVIRRHRLPELNARIPAATGAAAAQRHPGEGQAAVRKTDHGDAIGEIPWLSRPGLNPDIRQPATPGHQELQPAADSHHSHPAIAR
jgi:hypothetical protein